MVLPSSAIERFVPSLYNLLLSKFHSIIMYYMHNQNRSYFPSKVQSPLLVPPWLWVPPAHHTPPRFLPSAPSTKGRPRAAPPCQGVWGSPVPQEARSQGQTPVSSLK